jgi:hypothetical protein
MSTPEDKEADPFYQQFRTFENHYLNLTITWTVFRVLYQDPTNVVTINEAARTTFHEIGRSLVEHLLIQLGRLTDRPIEGKAEYLSLRMLCREMERCLAISTRVTPEPYLFAERNHGKPMQSRAERDTAFLSEVGSMLTRLEPTLAKLHKHRNKWIAHLDFNHAIEPSRQPLPALPFLELDEAIETIGGILKTVSSYFWQAGPSYHYPYMRDPEELVAVLRLGIQSRTSRQVGNQD